MNTCWYCKSFAFLFTDCGSTSISETFSFITSPFSNILLQKLGCQLRCFQNPARYWMQAVTIWCQSCMNFKYLFSLLVNNTLHSHKEKSLWTRTNTHSILKKFSPTCKLNNFLFISSWDRAPNWIMPKNPIHPMSFKFYYAWTCHTVWPEITNNT